MTDIENFLSFSFKLNQLYKYFVEIILDHFLSQQPLRNSAFASNNFERCMVCVEFEMCVTSNVGT